jgi:hypothetical protein
MSTLASAIGLAERAAGNRAPMAMRIALTGPWHRALAEAGLPPAELPADWADPEVWAQLNAGFSPEPASKWFADLLAGEVAARAPAPRAAPPAIAPAPASAAAPAAPAAARKRAGPEPADPEASEGEAGERAARPAKRRTLASLADDDLAFGAQRWADAARLAAVCRGAFFKLN